MKKIFITSFCVILIFGVYNSLLDKKIESYVDERVTASHSEIVENTLIQEKEQEVENDKNTENYDADKDELTVTNTGENVWIPSAGSKYHDNPVCSKMKNPTQVTKSQAISMGYSACKKCY